MQVTFCLLEASNIMHSFTHMRRDATVHFCSHFIFHHSPTLISHSLSIHHQYADDTQQYIAVSRSDLQEKLARLRPAWCSLNECYLGKDAYITLYKALVRSQLEYAVQVWSPYTVAYIKKIQKVHMRANILITCIKHLTYAERLSYLNVPMPIEDYVGKWLWFLRL